jgi:hypothetical protein
VPKAFEFTKILPNTRKIGPGRLAKVLPTFQKKILRQKHICRNQKQARMPWQFSKACDVTLRNLSSNRSKGFELAGFEKLSENSKAFGSKQLQ